MNDIPNPHSRIGQGNVKSHLWPWSSSNMVEMWQGSPFFPSVILDFPSQEHCTRQLGQVSLTHISTPSCANSILDDSKKLADSLNHNDPIILLKGFFNKTPQQIIKVAVFL